MCVVRALYREVCSLNVAKGNVVLVAALKEAHSHKWYSFVENMRTVGPDEQMSSYCVKWLNLPSVLTILT